MAQQPQVTSKYSGKRLLIADDDSDMRVLLAEYFRRLGFQVDERESGHAALEAAMAGRFMSSMNWESLRLMASTFPQSRLGRVACDSKILR